MTMGTVAEGPMPKSNPNPEVAIEGAPKVSSYENCREERIKENLQRMQNLGIFNLSFNLKSETRPVQRRYRNPAQTSTPPLQPSRRSSRLENTAPVKYSEGKNVKGKKTSNQRSVVVIGEGTRAEIYTEEDEKLLGNTERSWTCFVDGYGKDGKRIYDPVKGKTCHQCRQKTLGYRTQCSECNLVQGQFCGDCLYMRYGEHVLEALENPNWICPACRGICNCSLCRNHKGWAPTGPIYRRIAQLGYKSVAHYLVQTKRAQTDDLTTPNQASAKRSLSFQEANSLPQIDDSLKKEEDEIPNEDLSFVLCRVKCQTPLCDDVKVFSYLEPPTQVKQEDDSCAHIGDDHPKIEELTGPPARYLLPGGIETLVDLCDGTETGGGNSVTVRETRGKRKAALEPNQDSIGGRLRQRRRSQSGV